MKNILNENESIYFNFIDRLNNQFRSNILSGFYFEDYIREFSYRYSLHENHIILTVNQPIGECEPIKPIFGTMVVRRGEMTKTIYYNNNTREIEYIEANVKAYNNCISYGSYSSYSYILSKVDLDLINNNIDELIEYLEENSNVIIND